MSIGRFLKDKWYYIATQMVVAFLLVGNMIVFRCNSFIVYLTTTGCLVSLVLPLAIEYGKKRKFYKEVNKCIETLDKKYLICELMPRPSFLEGQITMDAMRNINQNMLDEIILYKRSIKEYREYIDMWVHEVKTPVTNVMLITENNKTPVLESVREEMEKIEAYIEQTLYYSKTNIVEKDYVISRQSLHKIVQAAIRANKKALIGNRIQIDLRELEVEVMTDSKWLLFILNQIITNCVKYRAGQRPCITFDMRNREESVTLYVTDNGIGIKEEEVPKVLEKGFVGSNGRMREATTGMGLYICNKLLMKMHHTISISSKEGEYTTVAITFPKTGYFLDR